MSSSNCSIYQSRQWMYRRINPATNEISQDFIDGLRDFMDFVSMQPICQESGKMYCPCPRCKNLKFISQEIACKHLFSRGFVENYFVWFMHGEDVNITDNSRQLESVSHPVASEADPVVVGGSFGTNLEDSTFNPYVEMVTDAFPDHDQVPNAWSKRFYEMLSC